jgi:hypothetical protein
MSDELQYIDMPLAAIHDPSDSAVQREIELLMLRRLGEQHLNWKGVLWKATAAELGLSQVWQKAEPDAVWKAECDGVIVAECYARIGKLKPGHRRKLAMDALKLLALQHALPDGSQVRFLLVVPEELTGCLVGDGWFPAALRLAAEIVPVALLQGERERLRNACRLQGQGQARTKKAGEDHRE